MRSRNAAGHAGFLNNLLALFNALAGFIESRLALFAKESRAAFAQILAVAACFIAALMFFAFGYIFLIASVIAAIAHAAQVSWLWLALAAAGVHFVLVLILLLVARSMMTKPPFRKLAAELTKDREWLKNLDETSRPGN